MTAAELRHVTRAYGRHIALKNVSLSVDRGEVLGLVGPNGAGKTTLLRILAGLIRPQHGARWVAQPGAERTVYFGGERTLPPGVRDCAWAQLWTGISRAGAGRAFGVLSRGTRQRAGLEAMLARSSISLLILDEPWEGLDPESTRWLTAALIAARAEGTAIVVSSHRIYDLAAVCDRCAILARGQVRGNIVCCTAGGSLDARSELLFRAFDRAVVGR
ncbi:MAG: ATP-binding cassette domain-containing protein [Betaproteobacteria bacterium]